MNTTRIHTDAVIAALEAAGLVVGDAEAVDATRVPLEPPYAVVYPMPGRLGGTMADPERDGQVVYQVTSVGVSRSEAEWVRDKAREVLLPGLVVAGRRIVRVKVEMVGEVARDDDVSPPRFFIPERFRFWSVPS